MTYTSRKTGKDYHLHKMVSAGGSTLHYFSKKKDESRLCSEIPPGFHVVESDNGFPILRKKS